MALDHLSVEAHDYRRVLSSVAGGPAVLVIGSGDRAQNRGVSDVKVVRRFRVLAGCVGGALARL